MNNIETIDGIDCPYCDNQGYTVVHKACSEPEQEPCEFCHCEPNSKFNLSRKEKQP